MANFFIKLIRHPILFVFFGDTAVFDRWLWLKKNIKYPGYRTLDAGCGSGALTLYSAHLGNDTTGISFESRNNGVGNSRAKILDLEKNIRFITGDLRELDRRSEIGKFDQIICFETIEHILDDKKLIGDFYNILNSGGKLFLTAPYKYYKRLPGDHIVSIENGDHIRWGYTFEELSLLLREAGFEIDRTDYITGFFSQLLIRIDRAVSQLNHRLAWLIIFPLRLLVFLDLIPVQYPYLSVGMVATKNL